MVNLISGKNMITTPTLDIQIIESLRDFPTLTPVLRDYYEN